MIPSPNADWGQIGAFALTFNGYDHWGSFAACGEVAEKALNDFEESGALPDTLTELRTCLFFEQRRWRHYGYAPDQEAMTYIHALVGEITAKVALEDLD